jgi:hypothetical protein
MRVTIGVEATLADHGAAGSSSPDRQDRGESEPANCSISSYPGNLVVNSTPVTTGSLVISFLLLCLWSIGGGLVSLFGTWVATVRHPHYLKPGE